MYRFFIYLLLPLYVIEKIYSKSFGRLTCAISENIIKLRLLIAKADFDPKKVSFRGKCAVSLYSNSKVSLGNGFICASVGSIDNSLCSKIVVCTGAELKIGECSGMTNSVVYCRESITIGSHVNIGAGTLIFDSDFHSTKFSDRMDRALDVNKAKTKPVVIGDGAFIGTRCVICKGCQIGKGAIIAAGSVVVKDVPPFQVWGGSPAKYIKDCLE